MKQIKRLRHAGTRIPLKFKVWMYFVLFILIVFSLLWFFQIFFLQTFYERMRINTASETMTTISDIYDSGDKEKFYAAINKLSKDNDLCIEVLDRYGREVKSAHVIGDCLLHDKHSNIHPFVEWIDAAENNVIKQKKNNPRSGYEMLIYGCTLESGSTVEGYLLINAVLVPVGATVDIIKRQLMIITVILIFLAFVLSLYLAKRISAPIDSITKASEKLAKGDFNTKFDGRGYLEAKKLADTLTYAEKELSKVC